MNRTFRFLLAAAALCALAACTGEPVLSGPASAAPRSARSSMDGAGAGEAVPLAAPHDAPPADSTGRWGGSLGSGN
jgi:predicted small lipoprotein YifL